MHEPAEVARATSVVERRVAAPVPARSRREPRGADRPRESRSLREAVLARWSSTSTDSTGPRSVPGRRARARRAAARRCSGSPAIAPRARIPTSCPPEHVAHGARDSRRRRDDRRRAGGRARPRSVDALRETARRHTADVREPAELHEQPARLRLRRRRLRRTAAATAWSTRSWRGATSTRSPQRVAAIRDAGADHVCIQVIRPDDEIPRADWRELAPALTANP